MSVELEGLATTVQKFKNSLQDVLRKDREDFHEVLNGETPISFDGIEDIDGSNKYIIEISDILFWHEPKGYIEELEKWKINAIKDKYEPVREYLIESEQVVVFSKMVNSLKKKRVQQYKDESVILDLQLINQRKRNDLQDLEFQHSASEYFSDEVSKTA